MREKLSTGKCHLGLDVRKFNSAEISTFYSKQSPFSLFYILSSILHHASQYLSILLCLF